MSEAKLVFPCKKIQNQRLVRTLATPSNL